MNIHHLLDIIDSRDFLVLDTETTGVDADSEIVQIAIIDAQAPDVPVLHTYIRPSAPIPLAAQSVHKISNVTVANAPTWDALHRQIADVLEARNVFAFNAGFDRRLMYQSTERYALDRIAWGDLAYWHCAMRLYIEYRAYSAGIRKRNYPLVAALRDLNIVSDADAHDALVDARAMLDVLLRIADNRAVFPAAGDDTQGGSSPSQQNAPRASTGAEPAILFGFQGRRK